LEEISNFFIPNIQGVQLLTCFSNLHIQIACPRKDFFFFHKTPPGAKPALVHDKQQYLAKSANQMKNE
jgi:hypothetical protein